MSCANCETELIPGKRFCHRCGTPVGCPHCGEPIRPDYRFCPSCGTALSGDVEPRRGGATRESRSRPAVPEELAQKLRGQSAVSGERKRATVVFCDLAGSTGIAERLDPEEYRDLLDAYLELAFAEIYRQEGIVNQLAGDGLMALFGAPLAHEDEPTRAVLAALAIGDALAEFNKTRAQPDAELHARIGVHTGMVVVGTVGNDLKMDYTAIGDTTNLASRLQSLAEPDSVLVSDATHRLIRDRFDLQEVGPFEVRGKSELVRAWKVLGPREVAGPMAIARERGLTPLVGRDAELAQLGGCFQRLEAGFPQLVSIVGDAGSGKSRVAYEFRQRLPEGAVVLETSCSSLTHSVPYAPWARLLRNELGIGREDGAEEARARLVEKLRALGADVGESCAVLCRLLSIHPGGDPLDGDLPRHRIFEALAPLILALSRGAPTVMVFEDLHWIDEPSLELLELAIARLEAAPLMLVVTHRPDYVPRWHVSVAFTQLHLRPLPPSDTLEIIRALAGGALPQELERRLLARAEGSPFFAEEISRLLVEDGLLTREKGEVRLTRPLDEIPIPATVQELVEARLDRLTPPAKRVAQIAAVVGRQFASDSVARLLDGEDIDVGEELLELAARGVIRPAPTSSGDEFRFGESVTQEIAYESLLLRDRRQLHEQIAQLLEDQGSAGPAVIAHHLARSDNREKAGEALLDAAREAEKVPSYGAALELYESAWSLAESALDDGESLEVYGRTALRATLGVARLNVIYNATGDADPEHACERGRELATLLGDNEALAGLYSMQGMLVGGGDRAAFERGRELIERGVAVARDAGLELTRLSVQRALCASYLLDGQFEEASGALAETLEDLERLGQHDPPSDIYFGALFFRDRVHFHSGDLDAAERSASDTYERATRAENRTVTAGAASILAQTALARGDPSSALRWAERALAVAVQLDHAPSLLSGSAVALSAQLALGDRSRASGYIERLEDSLDVARDPLMVETIVDGLLTVGEVNRAHEWVKRVRARSGGRLTRLLSEIALGRVLTRRGAQHWAEATRCFKSAGKLAEELSAHGPLAATLLGAGELSRASGAVDRAEDFLRRAESIARKHGFGRIAARAGELLES